MKQFNSYKIRFTNCLLGCTTWILIIFINNFHVYFHCPNILRCTVVNFIISFKRNTPFSMDTFFCINILSIFTGLFNHFVSIHGFFNFVINLIWLFCNISRINNFLFVKPIRIFRSFFLCIIHNNCLFCWVVYIYRWMQFIDEGFPLESFFNDHWFHLRMSNQI